MVIGGRGGIRTPDPGVANAVLSQLSYTPLFAINNYNIAERAPATDRILLSKTIHRAEVKVRRGCRGISGFAFGIRVRMIAFLLATARPIRPHPLRDFFAFLGAHRFSAAAGARGGQVFSPVAYALQFFQRSNCSLESLSFRVQ